MDKRWKNLGIIVIAIALLFIIYFLSIAFYSKGVVEILNDNEYSIESFSFSISSFVNPLDPKLISDLENFSGSNEDKAYVVKVLEIENDKKIILENYFEFVQGDYLDTCDNLHIIEENLSELSLDVIEDSEELGRMPNSFGADVNFDNLFYQYETLLMSMSSAEESCFSLWEIIEYEYMEEEFDE